MRERRKEKWGKGKKPWRKPFTKSKIFSYGCRCHGSCGYCYDNRTRFDKKPRHFADLELELYLEYGDEE